MSEQLIDFKECKRGVFENGEYQYTEVIKGGDFIRKEVDNDSHFIYTGSKPPITEVLNMPYLDTEGLVVTFLGNGEVNPDSFDIDKIKRLAKAGDKMAKLLLFSYEQGLNS